MMTVAVILPWLALEMPADSSALMQGFVVAVAVGAALYSAIFVTLGLTSKRALVIGLLYIVVLEITISPNVPGLKSLSRARVCDDGRAENWERARRGSARWWCR